MNAKQQLEKLLVSTTTIQLSLIDETRSDPGRVTRLTSRRIHGTGKFEITTVYGDVAEIPETNGDLTAVLYFGEWSNFLTACQALTKIDLPTPKGKKQIVINW